MSSPLIFKQLGTGNQTTAQEMLSSTPCLICVKHQRDCDRVKPVCNACRNSKEIICKWRVASNSGTISDWAQKGIDDDVASREPSGISSPHPGYLLFRWAHGAPEVEMFFKNERCRRLFDVDQELRELFALITAEETSGQKNAALALLSLNLRDTSPVWDERASERYGSAMSLISSSINSSNLLDTRRDTAVAVALANKFEFFNSSRASPSYAHLTGLRELIQSPLFGPGGIWAPSILIKILIYYTAIGSTFSFSRISEHIDVSYVDDLWRRLSNAPNHNGFVNESFQGIPIFYFSIIFRTAYARRDARSDTPDTRNVEHLQALSQTLLSEADDSYPPEKQPVIQLFKSACLVFLAKVLNPASKAEDVQYYFQDIWPSVLNIDWSCHSLVLVWPLVILYCVGNRGHRDDIRDMLRRIEVSFGVAKLTSTLEFLQSVEELQGDTGQDELFGLLLQSDVPSITLY